MNIVRFTSGTPSNTSNGSSSSAPPQSAGFRPLSALSNSSSTAAYSVFEQSEKLSAPPRTPERKTPQLSTDTPPKRSSIESPGKILKKPKPSDPPEQGSLCDLSNRMDDPQGKSHTQWQAFKPHDPVDPNQLGTVPLEGSQENEPKPFQLSRTYTCVNLRPLYPSAPTNQKITDEYALIMEKFNQGLPIDGDK